MLPHVVYMYQKKKLQKEADIKKGDPADPNAIEAVAAGALRTWFDAYTSLRGAGVLSTQARSYASSWNNGNLNFYSSVDNATASPDQWVRMGRPWQNDPSAAARTRSPTSQWPVW